MTKRIASALALALLLVPVAASAQIRQVSSSSSSEARSTVNFTIGYFALKGLEARANDDVLVGDLLSAQPLFFQVKDLNSAVVGGEYLYAATRNVEIGVGLGFAQRTVPSVYANLTHPNGDEIAQDIKLRQVPVSFTGRFLILPQGSTVEPYVGAGLTAIRWQYSETGEFVDGDVIFPANYIANGTAAGPVVLGGVRAGAGRATFGGELRWQHVKAKGLAPSGFLGDTLDLGGLHANFTVGVRF